MRNGPSIITALLTWQYCVLRIDRYLFCESCDVISLVA